MPDAVNSFLRNGNLNETHEIQSNLINQCKADFSKYEEEDEKLKLIAIYGSIPLQLNKRNTRFVFTYLNKELKFDRYENSFLWLKEAGVALPVYIANQLEAPLEASKEKNAFKLFLSDVGLLASCFPAPSGVPSPQALPKASRKDPSTNPSWRKSYLPRA